MIEKGKWVRCGKLEAPQIRKSFESGTNTEFSSG